MKEPRFKMWSPELTIDLKEIMLNNEWYYKISSPKKTDLILIWLYFFAWIWFIHTIMFYIYPLIK